MTHQWKPEIRSRRRYREPLVLPLPGGLEREGRDLAARRIALFLHRPVILTDPDGLSMNAGWF